VLGLEMADDRLDGGSALHLAADGGSDAADLARDPDPEPVRVIVTTVALIDMNAAALDARKRLEPGEDGPERVSIVGVPMQRLGMEDELAATWVRCRALHTLGKTSTTERRGAR
jgi:hypothetical protein